MKFFQLTLSIIFFSLILSCNMNEGQDKSKVEKPKLISKSIDTLLVVDKIIEEPSFDYEEHNRWLALHNDWDTVMKAEWIDSIRVVSSFKHKILSYKDSFLHGNRKLIKGMLKDEIDSTWMKNSNYLYSSQISKTGKYLSFIMDWGHEGIMSLLDIENNSVYPIGGRGPYLWSSWSKDDLYCISLSGYEEFMELTYFNTRSKVDKSFPIVEKISNNKAIHFDTNSLIWISEEQFTMDVYLFCFTYGYDNASSDCVEWNWSSEDLYDRAIKKGEKYKYEFSCETGEISLVK